MSCIEEPGAGHRTPAVVSPVLEREGASPFALLAILFLMQPTKLLAAFAVRVHCWLTGSLLLTMLPKSFSWAAFQPPALVLGFHPMVQDLAFSPRGSCCANPQPVKAALHGSTALPVSAAPLFCDLCELAEGALCLLVEVVDEDANEESPLGVRKAIDSCQEVAR